MGSSRSRRWAALGIAIVAAAGALSAWRTGVLAPTATSAGPGSQAAPRPPTAAVRRQGISATTPMNATLSYAGSYVVRGQGGATLTWLPSAGRVIGQGHALYRTDNGNPVVLLYGNVPAWRALYAGVTGQDVSQLNHDLVALGDANSAETSALGWDYFSWETTAGVAQLQSALGMSYPSGTLPLGQIVFEPEALRVSRVIMSLGGPASGPVLTATSNRHVVAISLNASQQSQVMVGVRVSVTLPEGKTTPGVISSIGKVAVGSGSSATIPVQVRLIRPSVAGSLDQAPVIVNITTAVARAALVVPVTALLAEAVQSDGAAGGGYEVEVVGPGSTRHWVPVKVGIFDDTDGLVQVTGALTPGQRVVVPSS
jgi:hypothetical protein